MVRMSLLVTILPQPGRGEPTTKTDSLREAFSNTFLLGTALSGTRLNPAERDLLRLHFRAVTPENSMKAQSVHPEESRYDFSRPDALVAMAGSNGLVVNGHTLVWHFQCPDWFFADGGKAAGRERVLQRMRDHIATVAGHYAGRVQSWDVVNEAVSDGNDELRNSKWLSSIGPEFVPEAFKVARAADPKARLYYNDYGIELPPKRDKALRLLRDVKKAGAPVDGVGIQGHWQLDRIPFREIEAAITAFHEEGLEVAITELDIDVCSRANEGADAAARQTDARNPFPGGLPAEYQKRLADQYAQLFALFLKHRDKISRVTFWGLHDGRSWLNYWPQPRTNHPLLWDRSAQPKPAFEAVLAVARNGHARTEAPDEALRGFGRVLHAANSVPAVPAWKQDPNLGPLGSPP